MPRSSSNLQKFYKQLGNLERRFREHLINPPMYNLIFKNKKGLQFNADIIPFNKNAWSQNPMLFCMDQYKNQHYFPIILICNDIGSIYNFTLDNLKSGIIAPLQTTIVRILDIPPTTDIRY